MEAASRLQSQKDARYEVRLSGSGGQGLILAGIILAEAAAIYDGKNAVQTQSYGPEARGGASKSEVVISNGEIDYPKVMQPDLLLAMMQEAADSYGSDLKPGGIILVDSSLVRNPPKGERVFSLAISEIAKRETGRVIAANIVALGAIVALSGVTSREAIEKAVLARVPKGTEEINRKALHAGLAAGDALRKGEAA